MASPRKWQPPTLDGCGAAGAACAALTAAALAQMAANVAGAIEGRDPEYLHQLRVGIRRLRTVLHIFKGKRLEKRLRKLTKPLGEARDWDVFVARFGHGKARRRAAQRRCRETLSSAELRAFFADTRNWARERAHADKRPALAAAAKALSRLHRKAMKRARHVDWHDEQGRHAVRIAIRRLRYACDFFSPCFDDSRRYLRGLADLQDLLGELNDIAVARRFGATRLERRERALVSELAPAWRAFERRRCFWIGKGTLRARAS